MKNFEILLDNLVYEPVKYKIEVKNNKLINLVKDKIHGVEYTKITYDNVDVKTIYSLGSGIMHSIFNWNRNIDEKINHRDGVNFLGEKYFRGTEKEKWELNDYDRKLVIDFPNDYFEFFIANIKKINKSYKQSIPLEIESSFRVDLNFPDIPEKSIIYFNKIYNTNFELEEIKQIDQMYFATINVSNQSMTDIFCLGCMISFDDERRYERFRNENNNNIYH